MARLTWRHRLPVCLLCVLLLGVSTTQANAQSAPWFTISDDAATWEQQHSLNLFDTGHPAGEALLYPGLTGEYSFTLYSEAEFDLGISLDVNDACDDNLPMEYRLLSNGEFVWGTQDTWLNTAAFNAHTATLRSGRAYALTLQWRWMYSTGEEGDIQDTAFATGATNQYDLEIAIEAGGEAGDTELPGGYTPDTGNPAEQEGHTEAQAGYTTGTADAGKSSRYGGTLQTGGTGTTQPVQTGDFAHRPWAVAAFCLAGLGAGLLVKRRRKENHT